jgi:hypothetical protein
MNSALRPKSPLILRFRISLSGPSIALPPEAVTIHHREMNKNSTLDRSLMDALRRTAMNHEQAAFRFHIDGSASSGG